MRVVVETDWKQTQSKKVSSGKPENATFWNFFQIRYEIRADKREYKVGNGIQAGFSR